MIVRCVCGHDFDAPAGDIRCTGCGAILEVRLGKVAVRCGCGVTLIVPEALRGKSARCTSCPSDVPIPFDAPPAPPRLKVAAADARPLEDTKGRRPWGYTLLLFPLLVSIFSGSPSFHERLAKELKTHQDLIQQHETVDEFLRALPGERGEAAILARTSGLPWAFAATSAVAFWGLLLFLFPMGRARSVHLWILGLLTGTVGILLLLGLQWLALFSGGIQGGGAVGLIILSVLRFIGESYALALNPENGFWRSLAGFTFGVGVCEEFCKVLPLAVAFRLGAQLDVRGAVAWGLAMGVGFGVSEGIHYSREYYNGLSGAEDYAVRFISCVALHSIWSGTAAILLWSNRAEFEEPEHWYGMILPVIFAILPPIALHGLYDTLLKRDLDLLAFVTAVGSFVLFYRLSASSRRKEAALDPPVP